MRLRGVFATLKENDYHNIHRKFQVHPLGGNRPPISKFNSLPHAYPKIGNKIVSAKTCIMTTKNDPTITRSNLVTETSVLACRGKSSRGWITVHLHLVDES